ncbi:synaptonemal complex protein 3 [Elysia marginata]|uniref:Synaptonemal complex protein 3 n=1 Tax=Elysia marginata TaxID=1093978 RepID=A0AAV4INC4_9GAST|nr:synaptonemal complex protein 3 [Elysia marginata]
MPRAKKPAYTSDFSNGLKNQNEPDMDLELEEDEANCGGSTNSSPQNQVAAQKKSPMMASTSGKKRPASDHYDPSDFSHEMQKMLEGFGADVSKTLNYKKKRMEQLTQSSLKSANKKVEEIWKNQQQARTKLQEEFSKQIHAVYQQWESDMEKSHEQEEKLNVCCHGFTREQKIY